ncbi:MAG: hypothetical protein KatS3mg014_0214 [Actinomycetota bacterium]|nr:MAG: hypothetical protein KatS3mg014_0214 [Actinomycetota bacterium]
MEAREGGGSATRYLERPEGRIAFDVVGEGPLVVCAPGMGDLRSVYRFLAPELADGRGSGSRRWTCAGHGESDATFTTYDDVAAGADLLALVGAPRRAGRPRRQLHGGGGRRSWAAAERAGPRRRPRPGRALRPERAGGARGAALAFRLGLLRPWGPVGVERLVRQALPGAPPRRPRRAPRADPREPAPAGALAGLPRDHPDLPRAGRRPGSGEVRAPSPGRHGRARPRLPRPRRGGRVDRGAPPRAGPPRPRAPATTPRPRTPRRGGAGRGPVRGPTPTAVPRAGLTRERVVAEALALADEVGFRAAHALPAGAPVRGRRAEPLQARGGAPRAPARGLAPRDPRALGEALARALDRRARARASARPRGAPSGRSRARTRGGTPPRCVRPPTEGAAWSAASEAVLRTVLEGARRPTGSRRGRGDPRREGRVVRAALHGFVSLETLGGFGLPQEVEGSFERLVGILDAGLRARRPRPVASP